METDSRKQGRAHLYQQIGYIYLSRFIWGNRHGTLPRDRGEGKEGSGSLFLYGSSPSWLCSLLGYGFINLSRGGKIGGSRFFYFIIKGGRSLLDSHLIGFHFSLLVHSGIEGRRGGANALDKRWLHRAIQYWNSGVPRFPLSFYQIVSSPRQT